MPQVAGNGRPIISAYAKGRRFECETRDYLRNLGWFVVMHARSSLPDLVAFRDGATLLVECKLGGYLPTPQRRRMARLARKQVRGRPILAFREARQIVLSQLSSKSARFDRPFDAGPYQDSSGEGSSGKGES